jgi:hypothetical protein
MGTTVVFSLVSTWISRQETEYSFSQTHMPTIRWRMFYDIIVGHLSGSNGTLISESSFLETTNILNELKECYICRCHHDSNEIIYEQGTNYGAGTSQGHS